MQTNTHISENNEETLTQQLVSKYLPYWPIYIIVIILALACAYAYLEYKTIPIYQASATLIIKDEKKGNEESKLMESLDQISSKKIVENEIEIIKSRKLMTDVIHKLGLYAPIFQKNDVQTTSAYLTSPIMVLAASPDSLNYVEKVLLKYDNNKNEVILDGEYKYPINQIVSTPFGKLQFLPNPYYQKPKKPNTEFFFTLINPADLAPGLLGGLNVEAASKLSSVLNLTYMDEVPQRAENILNQLISSYRQSEINDKDAVAKNTLAFVEERLRFVSHDLDSIEKKIQQYKSGKGATDLGTQGQLYLQNVSANDQKLSEVNTQLSVLDQVEKFVKNKENTNSIVPSTLGVNDPMLSQLMDKLYASELEYERLRKTVGENNPNLVAIKDQINKIKPNILQNIKSQQQSLNAAKRNIASTNSSYNSMLQAVPQKERQLLDISREQQIKTDIYSFLLQKREESEIAYASAVSNNRIVDNARAGGGPVSPNRKLIMAFFVIVFMGICLAIITIRESFTGKILYRKEVENLTSIPIIAEIAFDKSKKAIVIESGRRSFIAEEFRKLRISLSFLGINSDHKKMLVTSSISGEGKSFIASNLAISLALTGKKVVVVDMDLNNPTIHKILNLEKREGVTEFLTGAKEPVEIIKRVAEYENLFYISAGNIPENPTELLSTGKVKELIGYLDSVFDFVVIDTSPMVLVTDGYLLTGLCDATLYVVRHKYTPKMLIKRLDINSHINPIKNPAIIFNGVKARGFFNNYYGYGYDYVYGGKYGSKQKDNEKKSLVKS